MTKLLDDAIDKVRLLSAPEQDYAAEMLLALVEDCAMVSAGNDALGPFREAVARGLEDLDEGRSRIIPDDELEAYISSLGESVSSEMRRRER